MVRTPGLAWQNGVRSKLLHCLTSLFAGRTDQLDNHLAVSEEDERRPELDSEGTTEPFSASIGDAHVLHLRVLREQRFHRG